MEEFNQKHEKDNQLDNVQNKKQSDSKIMVAGIMLILAGIMALLMWIFVFSIDYSMLNISLNETFNEAQNITITPNQIQTMMNICASIGAILSVFPILGGILTLQKKLWGGALACSIIGLFIVGPIFISSILCLVSLILLIMTKEQFNVKDEENNYMQ